MLNTARQEPCVAPPGEIVRFRSASKALAGVAKLPRIETRVPRSAVTGLRQRANSIEFSSRWTSVARGETSGPLGRSDPIEASIAGAGPSEEISVSFNSYASFVRISSGTTNSEAAVCSLPLRMIWTELTLVESAAMCRSAAG